MNSVQFDVVCVGHLAIDRIVVGGESTTSVGGAVYYGGAVLAALGLNVAAVTRIGRSDWAWLERLEDVGVTVLPVEAEGTSGIENIYPDPGSDRRVCHPLGFAGTFLPEDIPDLSTRLFVLGPIMPDEVGIPLLRALAARGPLALDLQGMLRRQRGQELVIDGWRLADEGLPLVGYLKADDVEARALTGLTDIGAAAHKMAEAGPAEVMVTHREGVVVLAEGELHSAPFTPRSLTGRTGRGDTCFAAYLGRRLLGDDPQRATKFAAALTTIKLERHGPFRDSTDDVPLE